MITITPTGRKETGQKKADEEYIYEECSMFLAGTIDNGDSNNWQEQLIEKIQDKVPGTFVVYNPRRESWDPNVTVEEQRKQIEWEQDKLHKCWFIVMVLLDGSKSPISLMELGEFCDSQKIIVFCTENFYRFENVRDLCERCSVILCKTNDIDEIAKKTLEIIDFNIN